MAIFDPTQQVSQYGREQADILTGLATSKVQSLIAVEKYKQSLLNQLRDEIDATSDELSDVAKTYAGGVVDRMKEEVKNEIMEKRSKLGITQVNANTISSARKAVTKIKNSVNLANIAGESYKSQANLALDFYKKGYIGGDKINGVLESMRGMLSDPTTYEKSLEEVSRDFRGVVNSAIDPVNFLWDTNFKFIADRYTQVTDETGRTVVTNVPQGLWTGRNVDVKAIEKIIAPQIERMMGEPVSDELIAATAQGIANRFDTKYQETQPSELDMEYRRSLIDARNRSGQGKQETDISNWITAIQRPYGVAGKDEKLSNDFERALGILKSDSQVNVARLVRGRESLVEMFGEDQIEQLEKLNGTPFNENADYIFVQYKNSTKLPDIVDLSKDASYQSLSNIVQDLNLYNPIKQFDLTENQPNNTQQTTTQNQDPLGIL